MITGGSYKDQNDGGQSMKFLITATILMIGLSAAAAPEVFGPRDVDVLLVDISNLPDGLTVTHTPDTVEPTLLGPGGHEWLHRTTVTSEVGPVTIVEYGYVVEKDGYWYRAVGEEGFSSQDFAKRFGCPEARIEAGATYTNEYTRSIKDNMPEQTARWYFIGVDAEGNKVKGEATVKLTGGFDGC